MVHAQKILKLAVMLTFVNNFCGSLPQKPPIQYLPLNKYYVVLRTRD
jgi:hypothetical protein